MVKTALFLVDVQNDFLPPNGALAVPRGREIIPVIGDLLDRNKWNWDLIIASQDYHPPGHISFASAHPPHSPFTDLKVTNIRGQEYIQTLWPDHCVQGTRGAEIDKETRDNLDSWKDRLKIVRKACHKCLEAYSAFEGYVTQGTNPSEPPAEVISGEETVDFDCNQVTDLLKSEGIDNVVITGIATEYCVKATALASLAVSFPTLLVAPAIRAVKDQSEPEVYAKIAEAGGEVVGYQDARDWEMRLRDWAGEVHNVVLRDIP